MFMFRSQTTNNNDEAAQASDNLIPFIAPKEGNYYTIWEILWLSCHFPKPVIYRKAQDYGYGPHKRTIGKWLTKHYLKEERIRKLLQHDEVGSREWLIKINILSRCGYAPRKDVLVSMFGVNAQPLVNGDKSISTSSSASASESTSKNCLNEQRFKEDNVLVGSRTSRQCKNQAEKGGLCKNGAYCDANDESTAFGSEFEMTTVAQSHLNDEDASEGRGGESVPVEVTIICQET